MISKCRDIMPCPIFIKQSAFNKTFRNDKPHFYTGISLKQQVILAALQVHKGEHIIFSDVDIILKDINLVDYLENYKCNDMTFLMEYDDKTLYNPGFSFIKSTEQTMEYFINVITYIETNDTDDMSAINYELNIRKSFNGIVGVFSVPEVININRKCENHSKNKIIQYICDNNNVEMKVMSDKLLSLALFSDVISNNTDLLIDCNKIYNGKCIYCNDTNGCIFWLWKNDDNSVQTMTGINKLLFDNTKKSRLISNLSGDKICKYFDKTQIMNTHDYQSDPGIKVFNNVRFRSQNVNEEWITNIGLYNNLIISTTNKSFTWDIIELKDALFDSTKDTYFNLLFNNKDDIVINEPVFLFMDYESLNGKHSFDIQFYLLFNYIASNINCKLLVVKSENIQYNQLLKLIKDNYKIEYLYIDPNINYCFSRFYCVQSYYDIFFDTIKSFINETLIKKIILKYNNNLPQYDNVYTLAYGSELSASEEFNNYCTSNNILNLDTITDNEYAIYLLNMSKKIIVSWGDKFIINILYYIEDLSNKEVILVPYKSDRTHHYITCNDNIIKLSMPSWRTRGYMGGIYNNFTFKGKLINGVEKDSDILDRWTFQTGTFLK